MQIYKHKSLSNLPAPNPCGFMANMRAHTQTGGTHKHVRRSAQPTTCTHECIQWPKKSTETRANIRQLPRGDAELLVTGQNG